jgi:transcriptional regulator with XRE-family HTH domain
MQTSNEKYDFTAIGQAIKQARESKGITREQVAEIFELAPRYIMSIENAGQHPSLQKFYEMVKLFDISVDQFFFPDKTDSRSTQRRQLDVMLDSIDERDLAVITATVKAMQEMKGTGE